jgi:hypothetical protein
MPLIIQVRMLREKFRLLNRRSRQTWEGEEEETDEKVILSNLK